MSKRIYESGIRSDFDRLQCQATVIRWIALACFLYGVVGTTCYSQLIGDEINFDRDVRPILSDNCFSCHGPDARQRDSQLRLDTKEGAFEDLGGYRAIEPSDSGSSELVRRIQSTDPDEVMPPAHHRKKLSAKQKLILIEWIQQGAIWSEHWSLIPIKEYSNPPVVDDAWPVNFVDHFVLAELERRQIALSPPADSRTLLRRVCFDLTGLPPSIDQVNQFLDDSSDDAYEELVDRLLASPHFGERMAVYWLDLVRYADSVGYHGDQSISVSPYRDYVINAFNENMPFDQFTREQLAGDLVPQPTEAQLIASGYNRLGMMSAEGGVQPEEYLVKYAADRVRTTASVWLGITLGCAECHDHKFDPFTTKDFYRFSAFFADIKEKGLYAGANRSNAWGPSIDVRDSQLAPLLQPIDEEIEALNNQIRDTPAVIAARQTWESDLSAKGTAWQTLQPIRIRALHEVKLAVGEKGTVLASGNNPDRNVYAITVDNSLTDITGFRLEALPDPSLPTKGPGRANNGNFVVSELIVLEGDRLDQFDELTKAYELWPDELKSKTVQLSDATATFEQTISAEEHPDKKFSATSAIDRNSAWGWAVMPNMGQPQELVVQTEATSGSIPKLTFVIQQLHGRGNHTLGKFRLSVSTSTRPVVDPLGRMPIDLQAIFGLEPSERNETQQNRLAEFYREMAPEFSEINRQLAAQTVKRKQLVDVHTRTSLITVSVPPRIIHVLPRGNWMDLSGDVVEPGVPEFFGSIESDHRLTRLDLADWITATGNPLTSRVLVNRLWKLFFGEGLSTVLDDLGSQGQPPTHPKLLEQLAGELIESGWDVKGLVKLIVMSQTYRQSSSERLELVEIDPGNRWLARQSRYRLEAEFIRDNALFVSGLLNPKIGGRSVKPYQPPGLYRHLNFPVRQYVADKGDAQYRRGLYTHWQRQYLHPAMKTLDAPAREECTASRPRSNTPLAALLLLNDPSYVEAAKALAEHSIRDHKQTNKRIDWLFQSAFSRPPTEEETNVVAGLVANHRSHYARHLEEARQLLQTGQTGLNDDIEASEHAAWTSAVRAIMNMHEFVTRN